MGAIDLFRAGHIRKSNSTTPYCSELWSNCPVLDISNVARHLFDLGPDCSLLPMMQDSMPPWLRFIAVFRNQSNTEMLCTCVYLDFQNAEFLDTVSRHKDFQEEVDALIEMGASAALYCDVFWPFDQHLYYLARIGAPCDSSGVVFPTGAVVPSYLLHICDGVSESGKHNATDAVSVVATACAFANCQNVTLETVKPSRQVRRHAERHNLPVFEHHVLKIDGPAPAPRPSAGTADGIAEPLHLVRGHFARYGPKFQTGKLFGRVEGKFWIPQHVRGSLDNGIITKDYEI